MSKRNTFVKAVSSLDSVATSEGKVLEGIATKKLQKTKGFVPSRDTAQPESQTGTVAIKDSIETEPEPAPASQPQIDIAALVKDAVQSAVAPFQQMIQQSQQQLTEAEQRRQQAEEDARKAQEEADRRVAEAQAQSQQQLDAVQTQLQESERAHQNLNDALSLHGRADTVQTPAFNRHTSVTQDSPRGLAADLFSLINDRSRVPTYNNVFGAGMHLTQRDGAPIARFINECFQDGYKRGRTWKDSALVKDVESWFKAHGLLRGSISTDAAGPTTATTVPGGFLDVLSSMMRETHNQSNVFWQFTTVVYDPSSAPSKNILIPRFAYLPAPTNIDDYRLASTNTYTPVPPAIGTQLDSQNLEMTTVPVTIEQFGLGRSTQVGNRPVFIPEFHQALSLVNLMDALETRLMQHYYKFEELIIRLEFEKATQVVYNNNGSVTSVPGDVTAGKDGTFTRDFANSLYSYLFAQQVPSLPDGRYILVLNPTAANQFKSSLTEMYLAPSADAIAAVSNIFRMATGVEIGQTSGYLGDYCNFHVFVGNSFGVSAAGASPTVQTSALGVGNTVTNDSFAFGPGAVGRGIAMPVEIRASNVNPFSLGESYIWVERSAVTSIDVDSAIDPNQQTRVFKARTTRAFV